MLDPGAIWERLCRARAAPEAVSAAAPVTTIRQQVFHVALLRVCSLALLACTAASARSWSARLWRLEPRRQHKEAMATRNAPTAGPAIQRMTFSAPPAVPSESPAAELLSEHCFAGKCSTSHVKPAVNRQPGYRRGTRRAFSKRTTGKSASLSNRQRIARTTAKLEMQTQSKSNKQSSNEQPASCQQKLARDTQKQTKQVRPSQLPANLKAPRRPATRSTQQPEGRNQQPDQ